MKKTLITVLILGLIIIFSDVSFSQMKAAEGPLKKVYMVYTDDMRGTSYLVEDLESVEFQGVKCLKADASVTPGWLKDTKAVYFPVSKIQVIIEYNSLKDYKESTEKYDKKQLEE